MLTLGQAVAQQGEQGASIETPYHNLTALGFTLRRGQTSMVAAAPGAGKSAFALDLAMRTPVRSLYISADTDSFTMGMRAAAKMSGHPQEQVERRMSDPDMAGQYHDLLAKLWNVRFSFDAACMEDVRDEVYAYATATGSFPPLIIVDNLVNVTESGDDDYRAMRQAVSDLDRLAHNTGAHVMVLHHANGKYEDGDTPIPQSGLENKVAKIPAQILTLTRRQEIELGVHIVKNRSGKADPKGGLVAHLIADMATMTIRDKQ
jgi:KaiC/GvpD/RAD55 family RecA-like ATPase